MFPSNSDSIHRGRRRHSSHDPADAAHTVGDKDDDSTRRKSRASLSNKRVSFGGTNIRTYYKDREYSNDAAFEAPPPKVRRSPSRPSPNPPPLPPRPFALAGREPMHGVPEPEYTFESLNGSDEASPTPPPRRKSNETVPFLSRTPSPEEIQNTNVINGVNIFHEEDIIMNGGLRRFSNIAGAADTTLEMPEWFSSTRRDSQNESVDEGDVTQQIPCMENFFKIDDPESPKSKSIRGESQPLVSGTTTSVATCSKITKPLADKPVATESICADDESDEASVDDFPTFAEMSQRSFDETSEDRRSQRAPEHNRSLDKFSEETAIAGTSALEQSDPVKSPNEPSKGSYSSSVNEKRVSRESDAISLDQMEPFSNFGAEEDDDVDMEDSCINLSMTGDMMMNLSEHHKSDSLQDSDKSRRTSSQNSTFDTPVHRLIDDDDDDDDDSGNGNNIHRSHFVDKPSIQDGSEVRHRTSDENWNDVRSSRTSGVCESNESEKSPTQRILLEDVPDGEDVTIHLHPVTEAGENENDYSDKDDITLQEMSVGPDHTARDATLPSPLRVKTAEDGDAPSIVAVENSVHTDSANVLNANHGNDTSVMQGEPYARSTDSGTEKDESCHGQGIGLERDGLVSKADASDAFNDGDGTSEGESLEVSLGEITPDDHGGDSEALKSVADTPGMSDSSTKARPPMVSGPNRNIQSAGTLILGKRKQTPHVLDTSAHAAKQRLNQENEVPQALIVSSSRPPLPTNRQRGDIAEISTDRHRNAVDNILRDLTPRSTPLTSSGMRRDTITLSATRNLAIRTNHEESETLLGPESFSIERFRHGLHVCNIEFNGGVRPARGASLMPSPMSGSEINRFEKSSSEARVLDGVRKSAVILLLQEQIRRLRDELEETSEEVHELDKRIEFEKPKVFQKLCDINIEDRESTKYSLHLKRLKKVCLVQARQSWVRDRMLWERQLGDRLSNVRAELMKDIDNLQQGSKAVEQVCADDDDNEMKDVIGKVPGKKDFLRARVVQEISQMRNAKGTISSLAEDEGDLRNLLEEADRDHEDIAEDIESLSKYAETYSEAKIFKFLIAGRELNEIASGLCGIFPVRVVPKLVVVMVGGHAQVSFSLHDEKVINISCKAVQCAIRGTHFENYMEGVMNVADEISGLRKVKYACHIGQALTRMSMYVEKAKAMYDDVEMLLRRKLGRIDGVGLVTGDIHGVEVRATIECFCVSRPAKFDVSAVGKTTVLENGRVGQVVEMTGVKWLCGSEPSESDIVKSLRYGSTRIPGIASLAGAFEGVRTMLNERPPMG